MAEPMRNPRLGCFVETPVAGEIVRAFVPPPLPPEPSAHNAGKGFPTPDGYIAAIAATHGFAVASRDTSAFKAAGVPVIDPWTAGR